MVSVGTDDGVPSDASIEVCSADGSTFTVRTLVRLGERIGGAGMPHGTMTDATSIAALTAGSLALEAVPAGLPRAEMIERMTTATADAEALARDRGGWAFVPTVLEGARYALWHRAHPLGFVAHADFGSRVMAAWGAGGLPAELLRLQLWESPD